MSKLDLSIIIVSFNTKEILTNCVESIVKYTKGIDYEIIVVDNDSQDGSPERIKELEKKYSQVSLIDAKANLGFGKANNLGAKKAKGEYLLFLNSDTLVFDNAIKESLENMKKIPGAGVYSCKLLNSNKTVQASGGYFPNFGNVFAWQFFIDDLPLVGGLIPSFHPQLSSYDRHKKMDWVTGAFMIIPKDVFDQVGGFDENIFMYTEEMELCYRLKKLGHQTVYQNSPSIIHLGGASSGSVLALTSEIKNMIYFWKKHKPSWQLPFIKFFFFIGSLLRLLIFGIIKGDEKARRAYTQALGLII
ncbi:MAG: Glycosyltransferase-like protein, family 2 [Candidatus Collierbacteria bacterium GW2011_GWA2_42_17]|uniref:Glycosyltransferase-like protein, family 2 n=1 Tax=Candidatus Collierbacteria bacterium GW2011_GWA2_42_17 TaxID=1618378 RepID=A0A0G0Z120_9BACT|nr:MAG: Glycosyltransferase-like protein, family 2 [Candidatus Collierbacteria bacterium GW2011_GWB2_42_12]KKS42502.1 MAG: Glycosyltransferase-like protein, family 2 [Candidatus Collierbacteria bacterium GW2011_GWA2_42_17]KKS61777.1 MAG: Glycosyltransferase-like protein, family 2 [Candidatus Collierbacteria bacterium GW2011_GWD2_42_50]HAS68890.1 glycosyltransferase family 2 protein [Candidatus Collierbacteria bacterium]